jgi:hypothetical protein
MKILILSCGILILHILILQFKEFNISPKFPINIKLGYTCKMIFEISLSEIESITVQIP